MKTEKGRGAGGLPIRRPIQSTFVTIKHIPNSYKLQATSYELVFLIRNLIFHLGKLQNVVLKMIPFKFWKIKLEARGSKLAAFSRALNG
jgi:hypothetical protein